MSLAARRALLALLSGATVLACPFAASLAQESPSNDAARWQKQADRFRLPLLAPSEPAGFTLSDFEATRNSCGEYPLTLSALYRRADGAEVEFTQAYPNFCGNIGEVDVGGSISVRGHDAEFLWAGGGHPCFQGEEAAPCNPEGTVDYTDSLALYWQESYRGLPATYFVTSNFVTPEPIEAFVATLREVLPAANRRPLWTRTRARVVRVTSSTRVIVKAGGRRTSITLSGIAPPPACGRSEATARLRRLLPGGTTVVLESDALLGPRNGERWIYRRGNQWQASETVNYRLVASGLGRVRGKSRFSQPLAWAQRQARSDRLGAYGQACGVQRPKPTTPTPRPTPAPSPSRPARSDAYNCDDFPLPDGTTAGEYLRLYPDDPSALDGDGDGRACE